MEVYGDYSETAERRQLVWWKGIGIYNWIKEGKNTYGIQGKERHVKEKKTKGNRCRREKQGEKGKGQTKKKERKKERKKRKRDKVFANRSMNAEESTIYGNTKKEGVRAGRGERNWCLILKIVFGLFCMHRGTVHMHVSSFLLPPFSGPLHKVCQFLFPVISHYKTSYKYDRRQSSVVVKKYVVRRYCFSDQTRTLQVAHSHATKQVTILTHEYPSLLLP